MSFHEEEVLGKAYDATLMRRLLQYLRPYKAQVALALAAIISASVLQLAQPYLMKLAIDRYIATRRSRRRRSHRDRVLLHPDRLVRPGVRPDVDCCR